MEEMICQQVKPPARPMRAESSLASQQNTSATPQQRMMDPRYNSNARGDHHEDDAAYMETQRSDASQQSAYSERGDHAKRMDTDPLFEQFEESVSEQINRIRLIRNRRK